jgi:hypothetical protein
MDESALIAEVQLRVFGRAPGLRIRLRGSSEPPKRFSMSHAADSRPLTTDAANRMDKASRANLLGRKQANS